MDGIKLGCCINPLHGGKGTAGMQDAETLQQCLQETRERSLEIHRQLEANTSRLREAHGKITRRSVKSVETNDQASVSLRPSKNKKPSTKRRAHKNVVPIEHLYARSRDARDRSPAVHSQQVIGAQLFAFPPGGRDNLRPVLARNASALSPLLDAPMSDAHVRRHFRDGLPAIEQFREGLHAPLIPLDNQSSQDQTRGPVTEFARARTMCPMGKASTPLTFKKAFCQRLKAARVVAGLEQAQFAEMLGLLPNTYSKYEKRSLLPHYLVARACDILGVDANFLFTGAASGKKSQAAAAEAAAEERPRARERA